MEKLTMLRYIKALLDIKAKVYIFVIVICSILNAIFAFYPVILIQKIVDCASNGGEQIIVSILQYGGIYLLMQIINSTFFALTSYYTSLLQAKIALQAQLNLFKSLSRTQTQYIKSNHSSELNNCLIKDTEYCAENLIRPFVNGLSAIFKFLSGFYFMSKINLYLTLIILPLGLLSSVIIEAIRKKTASNMIRQRESMSLMWKTFTEGIYGFLPIKLHRFTENYYKKVVKNGEKLADTQVQQGKLESLTYFYTSSLFMISIGIILIASAVLVTKNLISIGGLTAILMYNHMLTDPLLEIIAINRDLIKLGVSIKRIQNILILPKDLEEQISMSVDEVVLENVTFSFQDQNILKDFSLQLTAPESMAIFGKTGIGKTTLVNLITKIYLPQKGSVIYKSDGEVREGIPKISYMLQDEYLFDDTIKNNILIGNPDLSKDDLQNVIEVCQLENVLINHCGNIGENGSLLSGGERKRVLLARTLADTNADIYILDELSASLDDKTFHNIFMKTEERLKDKIRIYIEHEQSIIDKVDVAIIMRNGSYQIHSNV